MSEHQSDADGTHEVPDDLQDMPVTTEDDVDEPEQGDPDADREVEDGVGYHDTEAVVLDTEDPDVPEDDEPDEPDTEDDESEGQGV